MPFLAADCSMLVQRGERERGCVQAGETMHVDGFRAAPEAIFVKKKLGKSIADSFKRESRGYS
jgi:hypothetical protein